MGFCAKHKSFFLKECKECVSELQPTVVQKKPVRKQVVKSPVKKVEKASPKKIVNASPMKDKKPFAKKVVKQPVTKSAQQPQKKPSVAPPVLKPVKNPKPVMESNKSSAVPSEQMDSFIENLIELKPSLGFPVFSVCDCNSFHTTGYLWGMYAARSLQQLGLPKGPVAIVNFDSHADTGKKDSQVVAIDRWGGMLVNSMAKAGFPACYLSVFNHPNGEGSAFSATEGAKKSAKLPTIGKALDQSKTFLDFWGKVETYFGKKIQYVFVSIDRDVLKNNYTQWGDGAIADHEALMVAMRTALAPLEVLKTSAQKTATLIGFDITGLPECNAVMKAPSDSKRMADKVWEDLDKELVALHSFAHTEFLSAGPKAGLSDIIFFSGSVSYQGPFGGDKDEEDCWNFKGNLTSGLKIPCSRRIQPGLSWYVSPLFAV
jgi:hypothetical protein